MARVCGHLETGLKRRRYGRSCTPNHGRAAILNHFGNSFRWLPTLIIFKLETYKHAHGNRVLMGPHSRRSTGLRPWAAPCIYHRAAFRLPCLDVSVSVFPMQVEGPDV